jgi:hypothetical protein
VALKQLCHCTKVSCHSLWWLCWCHLLTPQVMECKECLTWRPVLMQSLVDYMVVPLHAPCMPYNPQPLGHPSSLLIQSRSSHTPINHQPHQQQQSSYNRPCCGYKEPRLLQAAAVCCTQLLPCWQPSALVLHLFDLCYIEAVKGDTP